MAMLTSVLFGCLPVLVLAITGTKPATELNCSYLPKAGFVYLVDNFVNTRSPREPNNSHSPLIRTASDTLHVTRDPRESIARIELAIQEPVIRSRFPHLRCVSNISYRTVRYTPGGLPDGGSYLVNIDLEEVTIKLEQDGMKIAESFWSAGAPEKIRFSEAHKYKYRRAEVSSEDLLTKLLGLGAFTPHDLTQLAHSKIPELRISAVAKLIDPAILTTVAIDDDEELVSRAAFKRINDQAYLAKIAIQAKHPIICMSSFMKLTDQTLIAKVAIEAKRWDTRLAAVQKLADQALLARVAVEHDDPHFREAAVKNLTDQTLLARVAAEDNDSWVRIAAFKKVNDQALFAKVAIEDKQWDVREVAVELLDDQAVLAKVAIGDKYSWVRIAAIRRLTNEVLLNSISNKDEEQDVRQAAKERLTELGRRN